ncbi:MAG: XrtA/PEP-CTERM system amidotransferase [Pseudomonadota bacterium]
MCGIAGLMHLRDGASVDGAALTQMTDVQAHRGPDGSGIWHAPGIGLGHRRLSIIDLGGGHQPMLAQEGRYAITFNGEIYNFKALRADLEALGHRFETNCDTEVLLASYIAWGQACLERITGMFAFAIWDNKDKSLFLARDRVGKKPLHYAVLPNGWLAFASELKGIMALGSLPLTIDERAVDAYFALGYVPDHLCLLRGVQKLPAGHSLFIERGKPVPKPSQYWDMRFDAALHAHGPDEMAQELRARLGSAVQARLMSDVPLGAFLSGGVDSSVVVSLMSEPMSSPVKTCSIGFDVPEFDETAHANQVASLLGTEHVTETVAQDNLHMLDDMAAVFDEPFADNSCLPTFEVCRVARKYVTVALSGDGGDEVFAGYRRYKFHTAEEKLRAALPFGLRRPVFGALGSVYPKLDWAPQMLRAKSTFQSLARSTAQAYFSSVSIASARDRALLRTDAFDTSLAGTKPEDHFEEIVADAGYEDPLSTVQYLDFKTWLVGDILTKVDRTSMANSLEVRVPLLDADFLSWAGNVPSSMRLSGGEGKWLLKKAFEDSLPRSILYRKKMGFSSPVDAWMDGGLRDIAEAATRSQALQDLGLVNAAGARKLLDEHHSGRRRHGRLLFALIMLEKSVSNLLGQTKTAGPGLAA